MPLEFSKAIRKKAPLLIGISGLSGSGKTMSALLLAAGLVGDKGRVGLIDTENGRGAIYSDSPSVVSALPDGYEYARMDPPFSPKMYTDALKSAANAGITTAIIDSTSHEWEGIGGCCEIAEENKLRGMPNWAMAKMEHKRFMNYCLSSQMNLIFCLRAREKVKMVDVVKNGRKSTEIIQVGVQAITEKGLVYEMLISLRVEEETHRAIPVKVPEPLIPLFPEAGLVTPEMGKRIRQWNDTGKATTAPDPRVQLQKQARLAAVDGISAYREFFESLPAGKQKYLAGTIHEECKMDAEQASAEPTTPEDEKES